MLFNEVEVLPFDFGCGKIAANIWKDLQLAHQHLEIKDIFIASIAIHNKVWLRTLNKKHFMGKKFNDLEWHGIKLEFHEWFDNENLLRQPITNTG